MSERFNSALTTFNEGRPAEALLAFEAILRERPDFLTARMSAATSFVGQPEKPLLQKPLHPFIDKAAADPHRGSDVGDRDPIGHE